MKRLLGILAAVSVLGLAGCASLGESTAAPASEAVMLAADNGGEFVIPTGGGEAYENIFSISGSFGADFFRAPGMLWYDYVLGNGDWGVNLGYRSYSTELGDSGWPELDAFNEKAHSWGVSASYKNANGVIANGTVVGLDFDFGMSIGGNTKISVGANGLWLDNPTDVWNANGNVNVMLYLMDELRVEAGYRYSRLMDGVDLGYQFWNASAEYLFDDLDLVLGFDYEREDINGATAGANMYRPGLKWYAGDIAFIGFATRFVRDSGGGIAVGAANVYELEVGFQLGNSIISLGWDRLVVTGGGGTNDAYRVTVGMPF